jgi:hypothetical protein
MGAHGGGGVAVPALCSLTGTNANFAELNRRPPDAAETALPCFSINPQVHCLRRLSR